MSELIIKDLFKSFHGAGESEKRVLAGVSLEVPAGSVASIVGANGSGKSTLLAIIAGMLRPDEGLVSIGGKPPAEAKIGFVWQNYRASLLPWLSVRENILFPLHLAGLSSSDQTARLDALMSDFGGQLPMSEKVYRLSGGQQQMTSLLRALIIQPDVLLLDEPSSALDLQAKWRLFDQIETMRMRSNITTVWVSHDPDEAALAADHILLLSGQEGLIQSSHANLCPRPRTTAMLTAGEHIITRNKILGFILQQSASLSPMSVPTP